MVQDVVAGHVVGARHRVVHVAGRKLLALGVVDDFLKQRLADALADAAVDLALDDHRVDDDAEVVAGDELQDLGLAGVRVDLDLGDEAAHREGEVERVVERALLQSGLHVGWQVVRGIGREADLVPAHRLVGAGGLHLAAFDDDALLGHLHLVGGDLLDLHLDLVERLDDGAHAHRTRARAIGAHAELHLVGVTVDDLDRVERHAEAVGDDLREGGLVPLAVAVGAGQDLDRADRVHADFRAFP